MKFVGANGFVVSGDIDGLINFTLLNPFKSLKLGTRIQYS